MDNENQPESRERIEEWNPCCQSSRRVSQPKLDRLAAARQTVGERFEGLLTQCPYPKPWWVECVQRSLENATQAFNQRDLDRGWGAIHDAERFMVFGLTDDDLLSRAATLAAECPSKLKNWRAEAVAALFQRAGLQELLKPDAPSLRDKGKRLALESAVAEALSVLHESSNNIYHRVHLVGEQLRNMVIWCGLILLAVLGASLVPDDHSSPFYFTKIFPVLLAGALGGVVSTMIQLSRVGESKIPESLVQGLITSGRPLVGAASALFLYVVLFSNVVTLISKPPDKDEAFAAALVLGFAAGFAEKLVLSTVAKLAGGSDAKGEKSGGKK